jgi:hypothetical protein
MRSMAEHTLRVVNCPCCGRFLFALESEASGAQASWSLTKDSPAVQRDAAGSFLKCPSCSKRVAVEQSASSLGGVRWLLSAKQRCDQILP